MAKEIWDFHVIGNKLHNLNNICVLILVIKINKKKSVHLFIYLYRGIIHNSHNLETT